ncbi:MAG: hypothetical protein B6U94_00715 [Thermofilum sp. ex4484_79]|nr:MAG: hypothetical protein B6U94_00715 [Thermofilum sp. ex4484_79]
MRREDLEVKKAAISDSRIIGFLEKELNLSKSMLRNIRMILTVINEFDEEKMSAIIKESNSLKREILGLQEDLLSYISRTSPALYHREDWIRIISKLGNVIDKMSGAAYRLEFLIKNKWEITSGIQKNLIELVDSVEEIINIYTNVLNLLIIDPVKASALRKNVSEKEAEIDELYRRSLFNTLKSNLSFSTILLLMNISEMLEDISDTINSAADDTYIILLDLI